MKQIPDLSLLLQQQYKVTEEQWDECVSEHTRAGVSLVRILTSKGLISEDGLLTLLSEQLGIPYTKIKEEEIDLALIKNIPAKLVAHYDFMPLKVHNGFLQIAIHDPLEIADLDEIGLMLHQEIEPVLVRQQDILDAIKKFYGVGADTLEALALKNPPEQELIKSEKSGSDLQDQTIDPSVIKFLNQVMLDAIKQRATDIHFEPYENDLRVRYRVDGVLYEIPCPPTIKQFQSSIASRIKVMANLDITEKRRPQDGRVDVATEGEVYDLRISIMPTPFGESIGIRILPRSSPIIGLEGLGLTDSEMEILGKTIKKPHGIILVTGPTGNGKTTTLYACLNTINSSERKILTIEDPIEYQFPGITQMQVDPKIGFTFATALRSMLRHDPDVMMIGEIRDTETAELAVRTALTGHLVFSTLHTNDAAGGITRLLDMGIDTFLVSSSVILIIAQRLVRLICPHCRQTYTPSAELLKQFTRGRTFTGPLFYGKGCESCRFTGYQGRTGLFEMLLISDPVRDLILKKAPSHQIKEKAISLGMRILKESGWIKIQKGLTTLEEVLRVTQEEEL